MNIAVACFSMTGVSGSMAQRLAEKLDAQYIEIVPKYNNIVFRALDSMRSFWGRKAAIKPCTTDLSGIDHLVIASSAATGMASSYVMEYTSLLTNCEGKKFSILIRESNANRGGLGKDRDHDGHRDYRGPVYTVGNAPKQIKEALEEKGMIFHSQGIISGQYRKADHDVEPSLDLLASKILYQN